MSQLTEEQSQKSSSLTLARALGIWFTLFFPRQVGKHIPYFNSHVFLQLKLSRLSQNSGIAA